MNCCQHIEEFLIIEKIRRKSISGTVLFKCVGVKSVGIKREGANGAAVEEQFYKIVEEQMVGERKARKQIYI